MNNLTKKKQSPHEITKEIMNIVETCHTLVEFGRYMYPL